MRYLLIASFLASAGAGQYAYVQYAPLTPEQRIEKAQQLPVVKQFVQHRETRMVNEAFDLDPDGIKTHFADGERQSWNSAEDLLAEARSGGWMALAMVERIKHAKDLLAEIIEKRDAAENGEASAVLEYFKVSQAMGDLIEINRATTMMAHHPDVLERYNMGILTGDNLDWSKLKDIDLNFDALFAGTNTGLPHVSNDRVSAIVGGSNPIFQMLTRDGSTGELDVASMIKELNLEDLLKDLENQ